MFNDRKDAGRRLATALNHYRTLDPLVLAIPRGGAEIGAEVARVLNADFSIIVTRKLPYPDTPESGFGAIAEDGSVYFAVEPWFLDEDDIKRIMDEQRAEIDRRIAVLRNGEPLPSLAGRTVILVDDGIAVGSTMRASLDLCRRRCAGSVVVAVPVAGAETVEEFRALANDIVVLEVPHHFRAVAQVYRAWHDVTDEEVLAIMRSWRREHHT